MKWFVLLITCALITSCSTKNQLIYLKDSKKEEANSWAKYSDIDNLIQKGDILKIDIHTAISEASVAYNRNNPKSVSNSIDLLMLDGYLVDENMTINFPILGKISVEKLNETKLEEKIKSLLIKGNHLTKPTVKITRLNNKFTVLGEVKNPGTFSYINKELNILQALGYAGDITIDGKRKDVTLIREENGKRKIFNIELTKSDFLESPVYKIRNNDVIIINPNFSKVKSAGFIGSTSSIASIASILLSITLLITNN